MSLGCTRRDRRADVGAGGTLRLGDGNGM